jgi:WD40 repeat protein
VCSSKDMKKIISASNDESIRIWDYNNFNCLAILNHSSFVTSVSISLDSTKIISGSGIIT